MEPGARRSKLRRGAAGTATSTHLGHRSYNRESDERASHRVAGSRAHTSKPMTVEPGITYTHNSFRDARRESTEAAEPILRRFAYPNQHIKDFGAGPNINVAPGVFDLRVLDSLISRKLVISELVQNVVLHSSLDDEAEFRVRIYTTTDRIRIEVEDRGAGFSRDELLPPSEDPWSGNGLRVVDAIASRWGAERSARGGTVAWAEIDK
jgi:Histidine kinase-like ATPase domain